MIIDFFFAWTQNPERAVGKPAVSYSSQRQAYRLLQASSLINRAIIVTSAVHLSQVSHLTMNYSDFLFFFGQREYEVFLSASYGPLGSPLPSASFVCSCPHSPRLAISVTWWESVVTTKVQKGIKSLFFLLPTFCLLDGLQCHKCSLCLHFTVLHLLCCSNYHVSVRVINDSGRHLQ